MKVYYSDNPITTMNSELVFVYEKDRTVPILREYYIYAIVINTSGEEKSFTLKYGSGVLTAGIGLVALISGLLI